MFCLLVKLLRAVYLYNLVSIKIRKLQYEKRDATWRTASNTTIVRHLISSTFDITSLKTQNSKLMFLFAHDIDITYVSKRLGHKNIQTTPKLLFGINAKKHQQAAI